MSNKKLDAFATDAPDETPALAQIRVNPSYARSPSLRNPWVSRLRARGALSDGIVLEGIQRPPVHARQFESFTRLAGLSNPSQGLMRGGVTAFLEGRT